MNQLWFDNMDDSPTNSSDKKDNESNKSENFNYDLNPHENEMEDQSNEKESTKRPQSTKRTRDTSAWRKQLETKNFLRLADFEEITNEEAKLYLDADKNVVIIKSNDTYYKLIDNLDLDLNFEISANNKTAIYNKIFMKTKQINAHANVDEICQHLVYLNPNLQEDEFDGKQLMIKKVRNLLRNHKRN